jgi:hypothetical protein
MVWDRRTKEGLARLIVGGALNLPLYFVLCRLAVWSSDAREIRLLFTGGSLGAIALWILIPVFWRGIPGQAPIALTFGVLPGYILFAYLSYVLF